MRHLTRSVTDESSERDRKLEKKEEIKENTGKY